MIHKVSLPCCYAFFGLISLILLAACRPSDAPRATAAPPSPTATATRVPPTASATSLPSNTPIPTATPTPEWPDPNWGPVPEGALIRLGKGEAMSLAISPNGQFIAVGSRLGVFLYRTDTKQLVWSQTDAGVDDVAYSPEGQWVAGAAGLDILLIDAASGALLQSWQVPDDSDEQYRDACEVAFSPDGRLLTSISGNGKIALWDLEQGEMKRILQHNTGSKDDSCAFAFSPDGTIIASAVYADLTVFSLETGRVMHSMQGEHTLPMGRESMNDVSFSLDGRVIATGNGVLWDVQTGQEILRLPDIESNNMHFSPDGETIAIAQYSQLSLWDIATGAMLWASHVQAINAINDIVFFPDGQMLLSASEAESVIYLDTENGERLDSIEGHFNTLELAFSEDARFLASLDWDKNVRVWDVNSLRLAYIFTKAVIADNGSIQRLDSSLELFPGIKFLTYDKGQTVSANGKIQAIGDSHGRVHIRNAETGLPIKDLLIPDSNNPVRHLALSADGQTLAASDITSDSIWFWDIESEAVIGYLGNSGWGIAYSPDGKYLATVSKDGSILLWDSANRLPMFPMAESSPTATPTPAITASPIPAPMPDRAIHPNAGAILGLAYASEGSKLTIVTKQGLFTFQNDRLQEKLRWPIDLDRYSLAVSPNGAMVATSGELENQWGIQLWDVASGKLLRTLTMDTGEWVNIPVFSNDSQQLAGIIASGRIAIWNVTTGRLVRIIGNEEMAAYTFDDMAFSPNGKIIAMGSSSELFIWNVETGELTIGKTLCRGSTNFDLIFAPDGNTLLFACGSYGYPLGFLSFWDIPSQSLKSYRDECSSIHSLAYSRDGEMRALGYYNGRIELRLKSGQSVDWWGHGEPRESWRPWDEEGNLIGEEHEVTALAFSAEGKFMASGSLDGSVIIWDLSNLEIASPSGCMLWTGLEVHVDENARLWSHPDASKGSIALDLIPGQSVYVLSGPLYGPILSNRSLSGWFWEVSLSPGGESAGWIWQERLQECERQR